MTSQIETVNLALGHLLRAPIQDLEEDSSEATVADQFWDNTLGQVLRDFPWPAYSRTVALSPVEHESTKWVYCYRYPADCAFFRGIESAVRNPSSRQRIPYRIGSDSEGKVIYTDQAEAVGEYTVRDINTGAMDEDFAMAVSWRLAAYMAPQLAEKEPMKVRKACFEGYAAELSKAQANAANEEQLEQEPESRLIQSRGEGFETLPPTSWPG